MSSPSVSPQATKIRWFIVAMLMGFTILGHFNRMSISIAGTERLTKDDGMTPEQMGWVYSAFLLVYTIGMLPGGWVIDRLGPRRALTGMGLGMGFCVALTGALGWTGLSIAAMWVPLLLIRGVAGGLSVPLHPAAARCVSLWLPVSNRTTANGLVTAGALLGIAGSYKGFGGLMDRFDWPLAFVICGTTMMLFSMIWFVLSSDDVASHSWTNSAEREMVQLPDDLGTRTKATVQDFLGLFRNRNLVLLTLSYAALSYFQYLFFYWIEDYFGKQLHLPVAESRGAATTVMLAMALGMAVGGITTDFLSRHWGRRWGCRGVAMIGMGMSTFFAWQGIAAKDPNLVVWYFSLALGALGLCEGIFWTAAPLLEFRNGGLAGAFLNTVGNAGGLIAPILTPLIGKHFGWSTAIAVACFTCGVGAVLWLWIDTDPDTESQQIGLQEMPEPEIVM